MVRAKYIQRCKKHLNKFDNITQATCESSRLVPKVPFCNLCDDKRTLHIRASRNNKDNASLMLLVFLFNISQII